MAGRRQFFVLSLYFVAFWNLSKGQDCAWDKDADFPLTPPLLLDSSLKMIYPVLEGSLRMVRVAAGSTITVACSGTTISCSRSRGCWREPVLAAQLITGDGTDNALNELGCVTPHLRACRRTWVPVRCRSWYLHAVGFNIATTGSFHEFESICFDHAAETTLYTKHTLHGANIIAKDVDPSRPPFKPDTGFFTVEVNTVYTQASQLALMEQLLGDSALANQIINPDQELFMSRGHLSPDADHVLIAEQDATYYFINVMPQWQAFNNGNWKYLEFAGRDLAVAHGTDLTVYDGGWGVLELDDINGNPVQIYLGLSEGKEVVPAPALMYKILHEESTNRAAAVIGINNPHITVAPTPICTDICSSLTWIDFDITDLFRGFTYCCTVDDLRAAIPHVPDLGNVGLLDS
uniref:Putative non-specific nuclease n=1 Tax=Palaemonidae sp. EAB-2006 TaxID=399436 RepID=Q0GIJ4_9EUCA|nr:putative non-specific nuclease [Palaemonidae sp. EAB-2006]